MIRLSRPGPVRLSLLSLALVLSSCLNVDTEGGGLSFGQLLGGRGTASSPVLVSEAPIGATGTSQRGDGGGDPGGGPYHVAPTPSPVPLKPGEYGLVSLDPYFAGTGATVKIRGQELGATGDKPFQVLFGSTLASDPGRLDDSTIEVKVPDGARSEDIVVLVSGTRSNSLPFKVLKALAVFGDQDLLSGTTRDYRVTAVDSEGTAIADPPVAWKTEGASIRQTWGRVEGLDPGEATLSATTGQLSNSAAIHVFKITGIALSTRFLELVAAPAGTPSATPAPGFVTASTVTATVEASDQASRARSVSWKISNPDLATVEGGLVRAQPTTTGGQAELTATSVDDPRVKATASVVVTPEAGLDLVVD